MRRNGCELPAKIQILTSEFDFVAPISQGHVTYQQPERYNYVTDGRINFKLAKNCVLLLAAILHVNV